MFVCICYSRVAIRLASEIQARRAMLLFFSTGDQPTDHNLQRLSHLASIDRFDDDPEIMHSWLCAVIQSIKALPSVAAIHFTGYYYLGDTHFCMTAKQRIEKWRQLAEELRSHVALAHADPSLKRDDGGPAKGVSERNETRGERILALCDKLSQASSGTPEFDRLLSEIAALGDSTIRLDVTDLRRLASRKRIANIGGHNYWIARNISHIRIVAGRLHHLSC